MRRSTIYSFQTGFILPDEALYYYSTFKYLQGSEDLVFYYTDRIPFQLLILTLSRIFFLTDVWRYLTFFSFFSALFTFLSAVIAKELRRNFNVWLFLLCPIFLAMSPLALTETLSLFLCLIGIRLLKSEYPSVSSFFFGFATLLREPYALFLVGNFVYLLWKDRGKGLTYLILSLMFLPPIMIYTAFRFFLPSSMQIPLTESPVAIFAQPKTGTEKTLISVLLPWERIVYSVYGVYCII